MVIVELDKLIEKNDTEGLEKAEDGWCFESGKKVTHIKVKTKESNSSFTIYVFRGGSLEN